MTLSIGFRVDRQNPGHTSFDVFAALARPGVDPVDVTRGNAGHLTLETAEFDRLREALAAVAGVHLDVYRAGEHEHPCINLTDDKQP